MEHLQYYRNGFFLLFSGILLAFFLSQSSLLQLMLFHLGTYRFLGAFIAGMLFSSTFTVPTAIVILFSLAHSFPPIAIGIIAGLGATLGNYFIFLFINKHIIHHLRSFYKNKRTKKHHKTLSSYSHYVIPFLGALILASPFPDEIGILLLSLFRMKTYQFLVLSFILKCIGIFLVVSTFKHLF